MLLKSKLSQNKYFLDFPHVFNIAILMPQECGSGDDVPHAPTPDHSSEVQLRDNTM